MDGLKNGSLGVGRWGGGKRAFRWPSCKKHWWRLLKKGAVDKVKGKSEVGLGGKRSHGEDGNKKKKLPPTNA